MKERINLLKKSLDEVAKISESQIAKRIKSIGFKCLYCARCCKEEYGDNTVIVFPFEIRRVSQKTGLKRDDIAVPSPSKDTDLKGNIHTFEWVLRKKGNCRFLENDLCKIYDCRPYICKTYPFYLQDGCLMVSECEGLGGEISNGESLKIAALLKERYIIELKESIALLERFRGFNAGGKGNVCVHDSEGEHWVVHASS